MTIASLALAGCAASRGPVGSTVATAMAPASDPLSHLAWLAGSWSNTEATHRGRETIEEHWTAPAGGSMFAMNRTVRGDKTVFFEYLRIEHRPDGIFYLASPRGRQPPTPFRLTESSPNRAVFENPEHDFPRKISYWLADDGSLHARIEGPRGGKPDSVDYHWRRSSLTAPAPVPGTQPAPRSAASP